MYRHAIEKLVDWKGSPCRKPLIVRGARQVGKTWLLKEFGRLHWEETAYLNFEGNRRMENLFAGDLGIPRILAGLRLETGKRIDPKTTLIIFDEVQEVPRALTALKYFHENAPEYAVVAAGSLLGIALHPGTSFPVGKVDFLDLHPFSFTEFLQATGKTDHLRLLQGLEWPQINVFSDVFADLLKQYYVVGGMPEAVAAFTARADFEEVREIQRKMLFAYEQDFSRHAPLSLVPRIRMVWNSVLSQLARENRKFVYGLLKQGARAREFETALAWLCDCGLLHRIHRLSAPSIPIKAYEDTGSFKLFLVDVGLLGAMGQLDPRTLLDGNRLFSEFKGALTEQFVMQQLTSMDNPPPLYYWSSDSGIAEVDFIAQFGGHVIPLEVKAGENLQAKSLKVYTQKFQPVRTIRTSLSDYREEGTLVNVPLYALSALTKIIGGIPGDARSR